MKTIRCNFKRACRIFATFTESLYKIMSIHPKKFQEISPVYRRIIARLYHYIMFEALSLLVY